MAQAEHIFRLSLASALSHSLAAAGPQDNHNTGRGDGCRGDELRYGESASGHRRQSWNHDGRSSSGWEWDGQGKEACVDRSLVGLLG